MKLGKHSKYLFKKQRWLLWQEQRDDILPTSSFYLGPLVSQAHSTPQTVMLGLHQPLC